MSKKKNNRVNNDVETVEVDRVEIETIPVERTEVDLPQKLPLIQRGKQFLEDHKDGAKKWGKRLAIGAGIVIGLVLGCNEFGKRCGDDSDETEDDSEEDIPDDGIIEVTEF